MKNRIVTLSVREIKKNIKRFISLVVLSFLGVTVFVGIKLASENMMASLDKYCDTHNMYDIRIISTLGLTESDVEAINKLDDKITAYGVHSKEFSLKANSTSAVIKITGVNEKYGSVLLKDGRMPKNKNEIVVEKSMLKKLNLKLGDTIDLDIQEDDKTVNSRVLKIVGTVVSPEYVINGNGGASRGTTTIGNGKINFYTYTVEDFFNIDYYTEIDVIVENDFRTNTKEYDLAISSIESKIKSIEYERRKGRYDEIVQEANKEIDKKEEEILKEFESVKSQLDSANSVLLSGLDTINSSESQLYTLKAELEKSFKQIQTSELEIKEAEDKLSSAKKQLDTAVSEINKKLADYKITYKELVVIKNALEGKELSKEDVISLIPSKIEYHDQLVQVVEYIYEKGYSEKINKLISDIDKQIIISIIPKDLENYDKVVEYINKLDTKKVREAILQHLLDPENIDLIKSLLKEDTKGYEELANALDSLKITASQILELFSGINQIEDGYASYYSGLEQLNSGKTKLEEGKTQYQQYLNLYNNGIYQLESGKKEYQEGRSKYQKSLDEYNSRKFDFEQTIKDAREKVKSIDIAKWYIYNRNNNNDYVSYINSIQSVENLSGIFPVVFFAVAIFMSLISMSRMAFESRGEIGTLKSLGFKNMEIRFKYILYSLMATLIGGILGAIFGFFALPYIIFKTYEMLYEIPIFVYSSNISTVFIGLGLSVVCICGSTIFTINGLIKEKTTELLRPKAPAKGKKILVERIKFIWNRLSFSNKVTVRNIFRYKKRVSMTVIGIVGCTVLLLSGYAIRDSIVNVVSTQYEDIFKYDDAIYVNDKLEEKELNELFSSKYIEQKSYTQMTTVKNNGRELNLLVPNSKEEFEKIIILKDNSTGEDIKLESGKIVITSKFAKMNKIKVNDKFEFTDVNNEKHTFVISGITKNYIGDFIYMDKATYEKEFEKYKTNMVYVNLDLENEDEVTKEILANKNVLGVNSINASLEGLNNIFASLDTIVLILVVFSGALAFVVLYNLSYINISERQREIATLKVLGFNPKEVDGYILKEEIIITIVGVLIGLVIGTWFGKVIVDTIEIDLVEFIKNITSLSYLKTFIFMILFTVVVNVRVHFALKKIDMIESLKSVE